MLILKWITSLLLIIAAVLFSLAHRQEVSFTWSPFHDPANVPLYLLALGMVGIGIFLGVIATWLSMGRLRKDRRTLRKTVKMLEKELGKANAEIFNGSLIEGPKDD
ncbi:MAG: LapA family protein [Rhodospirillales bacterium]|nr:LapA family protein [Alphaproteobacteria bacterium]USO03988.1 MAG: LapA family protein [Rhodospirillales bacterium]